MTNKQKAIKKLLKKLNWIKKDSGLGVGRLRSSVQATKKDKLNRRTNRKLQDKKIIESELG